MRSLTHEENECAALFFDAQAHLDIGHICLPNVQLDLQRCIGERALYIPGSGAENPNLFRDKQVSAEGP